MKLIKDENLFDKTLLKLRTSEARYSGVTLTYEEVKVLVEDMDETNDILKEFCDALDQFETRTEA